jgi:arginase
VRRIAVLDAPSNLGLRPPTATSVPGCAKAPGALRDNGLLTRLNARDAGCLTPPRYDPGDWRPGDGVAHSAQIAAYSRALADRIGAILDVGEFPVVLGGDCSVLLGSGLAMHRLGEAVGGRIGLVFVDGHSDFRHPGNASYVGAAAGEDLALVTGRGQPDLASIEGRRPYFRDIDVVVLGIRAQDEYRLDLQAAGIVTRPVPALRAEGAARSAQWARDQLVDCAGYWVHVDVDVLDPAVMPAVDAPSPGGIAFPELELLLAGLVESPHCLGVEITVFDPDYDPDGAYAAEITSAVVAGLAAAHTVSPRPDLIAARADLTRADLNIGAPDDQATRRRRRAAAATESVPPAAVGRSAGRQPAPAETAVPATAAVDIEQSDALAAAAAAAAAAADEFGVARAGSPAGEPAADLDEAPEDESAAELGPGRAGPTDYWTDTGEPAETDEPGTAPAEPEFGDFAPSDFARANLEHADLVQADLAEPDLADPDLAEPDLADPDLADPDLADPDLAEADLARAGHPEQGDSAADEGHPVTRPLGQAPLLDSKPLPATRPGMLRPRVTDDGPPPGFSLPVQRPAFDLGSGEPADIA